MFDKMKKLLILLGLCIGLKGGVFAQMSSSQSFDKTLSVGLKGGINLPRMWYFNNSALSELPQSIVFTPTGGIFLDIPITDGLYLSPEVDYVQRGTDISYVHKNTGSNIHYSISASYVDFRLPLEMSWEIKPYFQPYVLVGAEMGVCMFGKIHIDRDGALDFHPDDMDVNSYSLSLIEAGDSIVSVLGDSNIPWSQAKELISDVFIASFNGSNMSMIHAGAFAGVGIRSKVSLGYQDILLKFNVSYHQGLLDSYSYYEKNGTMQSINVNAYHITGSRLPQGLEVTLGVAIPLKPRLKDACASFANDRYRRHGNRRQLFGY